MAGNATNGLPVLGADGFRRMTGGELIPVDTGLASGANPQTAALSAFQAAGFAAQMIGNTGTASSDAVTISKTGGMITSEAKTTAVGAAFTITLTNSVIAATSTVQATAHDLSNTAGKASVSAITPGAGSATIAVTNVGTAAFNGTFNIPFRVVA